MDGAGQPVSAPALTLVCGAAFDPLPAPLGSCAQPCYGGGSRQLAIALAVLTLPGSVGGTHEAGEHICGHTIHVIVWDVVASGSRWV